MTLISVNFVTTTLPENDTSILRHLVDTYPSMVMIPMASGMAIFFEVLTCTFILLFVIVNLTLSFQTNRLVKENATHLSEITIEMQLNLFKFLKIKVVDEIIFFFFPILILIFGPIISGNYGFVLSVTAFSSLSTYSIIHCINIMYHVRFYREWVLRKVGCKKGGMSRKRTYISGDSNVKRNSVLPQ